MLKPGGNHRHSYIRHLKWLYFLMKYYHPSLPIHASFSPVLALSICSNRLITISKTKDRYYITANLTSVHSRQKSSLLFSSPSWALTPALSFSRQWKLLFAAIQKILPLDPGWIPITVGRCWNFALGRFVIKTVLIGPNLVFPIQVSINKSHMFWILNFI